MLKLVYVATTWRTHRTCYGSACINFSYMYTQRKNFIAKEKT